MGYNTRFRGVLKFTCPMDVEKLQHLAKFLNSADPEDYPDWIIPAGAKKPYIQLRVTKDYSGIEWDKSDKFYDATDAVNIILVNMRAKYPEFGLTGSLEAQGEDMIDRWTLVVEDNVAKEIPYINPYGKEICCPNCRKKFILDTQTFKPEERI